ncbi:MAG: hydroxyacid dehydrogenase [Desulfobacterales bacterium]|nr:hydroxyacid dehydrogenase [Desulfobacterales bacterium]
MLKIFLSHNPEDLEVYFKKAYSALKEQCNVVLNPKDRNLDTDEVIETAQGCQVLICHRATHGKAAIFENLPDLAVFLRPQVDISDIDVAAASANGILVANSVPAFIPATAEMALALMLDLARDVTSSTIVFNSGDIPPSNMGRQLNGSTAGIIGYGAVGSYLAEKLVALGMRVLVNDPYVTADHEKIEQVDFETVLSQADFVLPLAAATEETENLIDARAFSLMKPDVYFINVSRGNLVDESALAAALQEKRIAKVAMDVGRAVDQRPSPRLAKLPGVVATPHLGGLTVQNAETQAWSAVEQIEALLRGEMVPRSINQEHAERLSRLWKKLGITAK